ncbi:hypothetical protein L218DRAFT_961739, partial [Marasmius fiardii PR-910]
MTEVSQVYVIPKSNIIYDGNKSDTSGWQTNPENMITLPTALVDDFYSNKFGFDLQMNKFITFPGISDTAKSLLKNCSLQFASDLNSHMYMLAHF